MTPTCSSFCFSFVLFRFVCVARYGLQHHSELVPWSRDDPQHRAARAGIQLKTDLPLNVCPCVRISFAISFSPLPCLCLKMIQMDIVFYRLPLTWATFLVPPPPKRHDTLTCGGQSARRLWDPHGPMAYGWCVRGTYRTQVHSQCIIVPALRSVWCPANCQNKKKKRNCDRWPSCSVNSWKMFV